jgi:hypothetical protein
MASGLGRSTTVLVYIVAFTYVASLAVICLRVLIERIWSGTLLVMYNVTSLIAVAASLLMMHVEAYKDGHWSWANYGFWWLLLAGDSFIGWFRLEGIPTEGKCLEDMVWPRLLQSPAVHSRSFFWLGNVRVLSGFKKVRFGVSGHLPVSLRVVVDHGSAFSRALQKGL